MRILIIQNNQAKFAAVYFIVKLAAIVACFYLNHRFLADNSFVGFLLFIAGANIMFFWSAVGSGLLRTMDEAQGLAFLTARELERRRNRLE